jgi:hypothetical protein
VHSLETVFLVTALEQVFQGEWTTALVYADWLEERGDTLASYIRAGARGEGVTVEAQCKQLLDSIHADPDGPHLGLGLARRSV